jgi:hypothetical protein
MVVERTATVARKAAPSDYRFHVLGHDPKHGRWILPVIIVAMVVLTYTFVNGIEPAVSPTGGPSGGEDPPFPTTPTSSTTTLPPNVAAFMVTLDIFENQLDQFSNEAERINAAWDSRSATFGETRASLETLKLELEQWENDVAQVDGVPPDLAEGHVNLVIEVSDLALKVEDIILGLEAPDDGTLRRSATAEYSVEIQEVADAILLIRDTASGGTTPPTTDGGSTDETTETSEAAETQA